jgi:hypothetical protein
MNTNWQEIIDELTPASCTFAGAVSESDISAFEHKLGLALPEDYRSFVSKFGCGSIGPIEIFGLGVNPTGIPSLVWFLNDLEKLGLTPVEAVLPVSPLGDGTYAAILTAPKGAFGRGAVIRWTPGITGTSIEALGSSFSTYLKEAVASSL